MGLAFCFIGGCLGFSSILILVFYMFGSSRMVFQNVFFSFSDWSVNVVFWMFRIVQLNSRSQSIPSNGFMSCRSVISIGKFFLILLVSASAVTFPAKVTSFLLRSWFFLVIGNLFLSFFL